ncbi:MAG: hypothetical protein LQ345_001584 [Seirophora villosa]|nr:MAG: hypothetical protein LQ345_001584 [Seirophora villosa]
MSLYQDSLSEKNPHDPRSTYFVSNNDKRSGPAGSLSKPFTGQALPSSPSQSPLPQTLHITVSTAFGIPTTLGASDDPHETALYHMHTQVVKAPHLSLFAAGHDGEAEEIANATISDKGESITCVVREKTFVSVKRKGKFSSSFLATVSASAAAGNEPSYEILWKGDGQSLHCENVSTGTELLSVEMGKPSKKEDWVVKGTCVFGEGAMEMGDEVRETLLVSGLAVQECKARKGHSFWSTVGKGGLSSVSI